MKPASISDALRCLEFLGIVKTIRKGGGVNRKATVRNVNLSVLTQWGAPPFEPKKRKKQKPEHNGDLEEQRGDLEEQDGDLDDQQGKHPQTLNEKLNIETECASATANTNEKKLKPHSNLTHTATWTDYQMTKA